LASGFCPNVADLRVERGSVTSSVGTLLLSRRRKAAKRRERLLDNHHYVDHNYHHVGGISLPRSEKGIEPCLAIVSHT
jgi:hypothetical protein